MTSGIPPSSTGASPNTRLNGWKEIAAHFGRGVRTVQRWEKAFGMPVYRLGTGRGENVHAFSEELDAWLATAARSRDLRDQPGDVEVPEPDQPAKDSRLAVPASGGPSAAAVPALADQRPLPALRRTVVGRIAWLALAAAVLATGVTATWLALRRPSVSAPPPMTHARPEPSTAVADGDALLVYDAGNRLLWRRQFDGPLPFKGDDTVGGDLGRRVWVKDVNGDGAREVLVFAARDGTRWPVTLYCLGADGTELWTRTPKSSVRFGQNDYSPPWSGHWMFITGPSQAPVLWVTWIHVESGFFPTLVERLSGKDGQPQTEYWSAGYVEVVTGATVQGRPSILVGAANNDHIGASLSVFDADKVTGSAVAESPDKVCGNCPPGGPRAFLVFPQLEMSRLCGGIPAIFDIRVADNGELSVWIRHTCPEGIGSVSYQLDRDLRPVSAEIGAEYRASHKNLEGRLKHPFGERDHRELWPVLVQDGARFVEVTGRTTGRITR